MRTLPVKHPNVFRELYIVFMQSLFVSVIVRIYYNNFVSSFPANWHFDSLMYDAIILTYIVMSVDYLYYRKGTWIYEK